MVGWGYCKLATGNAEAASLAETGTICRTIAGDKKITTPVPVQVATTAGIELPLTEAVLGNIYHSHNPGT